MCVDLRGALSLAVASQNSRRVLRKDKRKFAEVSPDLVRVVFFTWPPEMHFFFLQTDRASDATEAALEKEHEERTKVKNIAQVQVGSYLLDTWCVSSNVSVRFFNLLCVQVLFTVPRAVSQPAEALHLRVLPQVHAQTQHARKAQGGFACSFPLC